jgi:COMPASS component SWD3
LACSPTAAREARTLLEHRAPICALSFSRDGKHLVSASEERTIKLWNVPHDDAISCFVRFWDAPSDHSIRTSKLDPKITRDNRNDLAFGPDGALIATATQFKTVKLWDAKQGRLTRTLSGHADKVLAVRSSLTESALPAAART